jgi:hypothetical protein
MVAFNKRPASRLLTSACGPCPKPLEGPNESSCIILTQIGGTSAIPFLASIEQFYCSNRAASPLAIAFLLASRSYEIDKQRANDTPPKPVAMLPAGAKAFA